MLLKTDPCFRWNTTQENKSCFERKRRHSCKRNRTSTFVLQNSKHFFNNKSCEKRNVRSFTDTFDLSLPKEVVSGKYKREFKRYPLTTCTVHSIDIWSIEKRIIPQKRLYTSCYLCPFYVFRLSFHPLFLVLEKYFPQKVVTKEEDETRVSYSLSFFWKTFRPHNDFYSDFALSFSCKTSFLLSLLFSYFFSSSKKSFFLLPFPVQLSFFPLLLLWVNKTNVKYM